MLLLLLLLLLLSLFFCSVKCKYHWLLQVIGLHKNGYGRILAECMFTSKIVYCLWLTLAKEDDNFVIQTTKPLSKFKNWSEQKQITFMKERILRKSNEQLFQVS